MVAGMPPPPPPAPIPFGAPGSFPDEFDPAMAPPELKTEVSVADIRLNKADA